MLGHFHEFAYFFLREYFDGSITFLHGGHAQISEILNMLVFSPDS